MTPGIRVYVLGPMTGYPLENRPAFKAATRKLRAMGFEVVSPDELDDLHPIEVPDWRGYMERDIPYLIQCQAGVALPGWRHSKGATLEGGILAHLGRPIYELPDLRRVPDEDMPRIVHPVRKRQ